MEKLYELKICCLFFSFLQLNRQTVIPAAEPSNAHQALYQL